MRRLPGADWVKREVLDGVGDVDVAALDAGLVQGLLERLPAGPTNGDP
jgi:hypothetical protein